MVRLATLGAVVVLAAIAAASAWWLSTALRAPSALSSDRGPAWYFQGAHVAVTGRGGDTIYRIDAARVVHDPDDDSALLAAPRLQWLQGGGPPLLVEAATGRIHADRSRVSLADGVSIVDESTGARFEFRSPDLEIDTGRRVAHTDSDIVILSAFGEMTGRGLVADMNAGTIRIESAVRGRYVP